MIAIWREGWDFAVGLGFCGGVQDSNHTRNCTFSSEPARFDEIIDLIFSRFRLSSPPSPEPR